MKDILFRTPLKKFLMEITETEKTLGIRPELLVDMIVMLRARVGNLPNALSGEEIIERSLLAARKDGYDQNRLETLINHLFDIQRHQEMIENVRRSDPKLRITPDWQLRVAMKDQL
ncbi:MAG TPA: hypothetical protein VL404_04160, partial [Candidatus Eisenbacteria bacterium]|nr:hypothetical protein [Candidatus Eisenbacteria bacterium]